MLDPGTNIVAIGASAGGVKAISKLISLLPEDLPACVLVVLHRAPDSVSHLHHILAQTTNLRVQIPHGGEELKPGLCLVAPTNVTIAVVFVVLMLLADMLWIVYPRLVEALLR